MNTEVHEKLEALALKRSIPFCYSDYIECPTGRCPKCGSDDLMRLLPGQGCEYGTDWIIQAILRDELIPVNVDATFEESVRECYPETVQVGWMTLDTVSVMKDMDPVSWDLAQSEWQSQEADDGNMISYDNGSTYFQTQDIEALLAGKKPGPA